MHLCIILSWGPLGEYSGVVQLAHVADFLVSYLLETAAYPSYASLGLRGLRLVKDGARLSFPIGPDKQKYIFILNRPQDTPPYVSDSYTCCTQCGHALPM